MTETIKPCTERIFNAVKTFDNSLKYGNLAQDVVNMTGVVPIIIRTDEKGQRHMIKADSTVRAIWEGAGTGASKEIAQEVDQNVVNNLILKNSP